MNRPLLQKIGALILLGVLLTVPLLMIGGTIQERSYYRSQAVAAIAAGSAGAQGLVGPVLVIPFDEEYDQELDDSDVRNGRNDRDNIAGKRLVRRKRSLSITLLPKRLHVDGSVRVERRAYGIHEASVFELQGVLSGNFDPPTEADLPAPGRNAVRTWGKPRLILGLADPRGLVTEPKLQLAGETLAVKRGVAPTELKSGFHADALASGLPTKALPFRIELNLLGTESLSVQPLADLTTTELHGNWPHPSFGGAFLPRERQLDETGFRARWSVSALASGEQKEILSAGAATLAHAEDKGFRVRFIDPVDIYHLAERAVKYGLLFVVVIFAAFFTLETLRRLAIHPLQYGLVGLALALFFLLLLSLSEHMGFALAYSVAALASTALIVVYLSAVLKGWKPALAVGAGLGTLYGALFGILQSEQNALLLGSLLLFAVLASVMLGTRRVNWYQAGLSKPERGEDQEPGRG